MCSCFWIIWIIYQVPATFKSWSNVAPLYFWYKPWTSSHQDSARSEGVRISLLASSFVNPVLFVFYPCCLLAHLTLLWLVPVITSACKQPKRTLSAAAQSSVLKLLGSWAHLRMWWKPRMLSQQNIQTHMVCLQCHESLKPALYPRVRTLALIALNERMFYGIHAPSSSHFAILRWGPYPHGLT